MNTKVNQAIIAAGTTYASIENIDSQEFIAALTQSFELDLPFMEKVAEMDVVFDEHQRFEELREICFDLLMINFFDEDVQKLEEDYLDSEEWEKIEEDTLDRGTELLNVFLYLRECADDEIKPSLEDYLKEFLLVEEDEFQDEYSIYEKVIANQILVESDYSEIAKVSKTIREDEELFELFYPLVAFFFESNPSAEGMKSFEENASNKAYESAIYQIIVSFNK